mgnify:CR=1 FL=1
MSRANKICKNCVKPFKEHHYRLREKMTGYCEPMKEPMLLNLKQLVRRFEE